MTPEINTSNPATNPTSNLTPSDDDERALYYVGGFCLKRLMELFKNSSEATELISSFAVDETQSPAADWTSSQSMGNLLFISDSFFYFIKLIEQQCFISLTDNNLRNCYLFDFLFTSCELNSEVKLQWRQLTDGAVSSVISVSLMTKCLTLFIRTRCKAYVNYLQRQMLTLQSSASLRQTLTTK